MTFVDLAGSERVARIVLTEFLYEEAIFINESLKYLAYVIRRLVDGRAPELINYEYHPLTCLVRDTLGGTSKTLVLVNISPSIYDMEATMDTLRFAEKTGRVKTQSGLITATKSNSTHGIRSKLMKSLNRDNSQFLSTIKIPRHLNHIFCRQQKHRQENTR